MSLIREIPLIHKERFILHIDADSFFATIEQSLNPKLKGKPVIIGGPTKNTGVVSTASYEAKKYGIKSAMPMYKASKLCPNAYIVKPRMDIYRKYSKKMYEIFLSHTPYVQMTSIDEAFLDITDIVNNYNESPKNIALLILNDVYNQLKISISCGCSSNKLISKIASSQNKPHKLTIVAYGSEKNFISNMPIAAIPGIGPKSSTFLIRYGLKTPNDIINLGLNNLIKILGKNATDLWKKSNGLDDSLVEFMPKDKKSISKEYTIYKKLKFKQYQTIIKQLLSPVIKQLNEFSYKAKTVSLKITYKNKNVYNFTTKHTYNINLGTLSSSYNVILKVLNKLFLKNYNKENTIRLLGVGVSNLRKNYNLDLFENENKSEALSKCLVNLQKQYGDNIISFK